MGVLARVCVCAGLGGAIVLSFFATSAPATAQSALLDALATRVTLAPSGGLPGEITAERIIRSGDTVATDETGRAMVTYPDGSTALLEEKSSLTIEFVQTSAGDYVVRMQQTLGRVWYAVTRAVALGSRYEVRSAGMASVVRAGSDSYVTVSPDGETSIVTISGTVDTSAGGAEVSVPAGSSTTVSGPGATPAPVSSEPVVAKTSTPAPATPAPTAAPTPTPAPSPTSAFVPPVTTLPPLPLMSATPRPKPPTPTVPIATPMPTAAPTPAPTKLKEKLIPTKDALDQPPPKVNDL